MTAPRAASSLFARRMPGRPQSARRTAPLLGLVLEAADVTEELGEGRVLHRLSKRRLNDPEIRALLGEDARRVAGLSVVWNEREGEIERVLETPQPSRKRRFDEDDDAVWALRGLAA